MVSIKDTAPLYQFGSQFGSRPCSMNIHKTGKVITTFSLESFRAPKSIDISAVPRCKRNRAELEWVDPLNVRQKVIWIGLDGYVDQEWQKGVCTFCALHMSDQSYRRLV